jgi:HlyD family secretion protein
MSPATEGEESIEIVTVERGSLATQITATGSVYSQAEVTLSFQVGGKIAEVLAEKGARVQEGQVLAKLDTSDLSLQVRSAEVGLTSAQAQLKKLQEGPSQEEIAAAEGQLRAAEATLAQATAQRDQLRAGTTSADIAAARAQLAARTAEQKAAVHLHDKTMRCETVKLPNGSEEQVCPLLGDPEEEARYSLQAANEALAAAQAQLDAVTAGVTSRLAAADAAVDTASAQCDIAQAQLELLKKGVSEADIAVAEAGVAQAEIALDTARMALEQAMLTAPFDGVVSQVSANPGEFVGPQLPVILIVDDQNFRVKGNIDEADIGLLSEGEIVNVDLDAFPGQEVTGHVVVIAPSATFDAGLVSYEVIVEIDETPLPLRGGMTANMQITREQREDVLLIPNLAIWIDPNTGRQFVEKQAGEGVEFAFIEQGITNDQFSEAISGVQEGDRLIVRMSSVRDRFREMMTSTMTGGNTP